VLAQSKAMNGDPTAMPVRRAYVLAMLTLVYTFNYVDLQVLVILAQPIKVEFGLRDWQIGFLTGTAFALFYATLGLPIARLADRSHRVNIIAIALALWSAMTALCAAAGSFVQLAAARVGVGIGEAGGGPPSVSLLSSYFPKGQRSTAMGIYALGPTVGLLVGFVVAGWINEAFGWRAAMLLVGGPGLLLAVVVKLTVLEPRVRGENGALPVGEAPSFGRSLATLRARRTYLPLNLAAVAAAVTVYGFMVWIPAYLIRTFGLNTREVGTLVGLSAGLAGSVGVFGGGWLADRLSRSDARWLVWLPAATTLLFVPSILLVLFAPTARTALLLLIPAYLLALAYTGPTWAVLQTIAPPNVRATAAAILLFLVNLIGLGLGPQAVGTLSDLFESESGAGELRIALAIVACVSALASIFYLLCARSVRMDFDSAESN
jgi:MFS family permease